jgi:polar amino acid transport system substrate-binding protein
MGSWKKWVAAPAVIAGILAIAACGSSNSSSSPTSSATTGSGTTASGTAVASVVKLVPAPVKSKGTLTVAADASYAPDEYFAPDGHTVVGMDPDLVKALAAVMGMKANVVNATFDSIIPGLAAGKYDMGASSFTDTKEREKTVDFVDYANVGESFYTKTSGGTSISTIDDICGKSVAVEKGTTEQTDAQTQSAKCTKAGKGAVKLLVFPDQNGANLAVSSGRAQLGFADQPVAAYQVKKTNGEFKLVGAAFATAPYGLAIPKSSHLAPAVLAALKEIMSNGTYSSILNHWGLQQVAISPSAVKIDGATS